MAKKTPPASVAAYLAAQPADRRAELETVRAMILKNLDKDYAEGIQYNMIGYFVPHSVYPAGYHCDPKQPLPFASLAAQKNHLALYMMCLYVHSSPGGKAAPFLAWFQAAWQKTGKKLDMGKACIRFRRAEDLALDVLAEAIRKVPAKTFIAEYEKARGTAGTARSTKKTPRKK